MNNRISLPIRFEESKSSETLSNSNFHKVKIYMCHDGLNLNDSIFSKEGIEASCDTLANIPILAFVKTDENGNKDFAGHEVDLDIFTDNDGKIKVREYYKEIPIGVIPETNEYFFEEIDGLNYLGCYGYIWKCYSNDAYDILLEDEEKEVSMEILVKECTYDGQNRCNINRFEFLGVTCLGANVPGAMGTENVLSMNFSVDEGNQEYFDTVEKLNKLLKSYRKEDISVEEEIKDVFAEEEEEKEVCPQCGKNPCECEEPKEEEFAEEENEEVCPVCGKNPCECEDEEYSEEFAEEEEEDEEEVCPVCGKNPCECQNEEDEEEMARKKKKCSVEEEVEIEEEIVKEAVEFSVEEPKEDFSLSLNNIFRSIRRFMETITYEYTSFWGETFQIQKYYVQDLIPNDNIVVLYDDEDGNCYGVNYALDNDDVVCNLESKVQYIQEWRPKEEGITRFEIDRVKSDAIYNMVRNELVELRQFKADIEAEVAYNELVDQVEGILANFNFNEEEVAELKSMVLNKEIDLERFEDKLCVLEVKKSRLEKFSRNEEGKGLNIVDLEEDEKPQGKYSSLIEKYGKKRK